LRRSFAAALLALATYGLVVAPLVHAEVHARESEADAEIASLLQRVAAHGPDFEQAFARLWDLGRGQRHKHSHGPAKQHGSGTLEHFALALHSPLPALDVPLPPPQRGPRAMAEPEQAPRQSWRAPARSQSPPLA
jgi:hypothetical protein